MPSVKMAKNVHKTFYFSSWNECPPGHTKFSIVHCWGALLGYRMVDRKIHDPDLLCWGVTRARGTSAWMEDWSGVMGGCDRKPQTEAGGHCTVLGVRGLRPRHWSKSGDETWVIANLLVSWALAFLDETMDSLAWFWLMLISLRKLEKIPC